MLEKSVVFVSENLGVLTSSVLGISKLLQPFHWPHVIVPVLPTSLYEILDAPVPLILGMQSSLPLKYKHLIYVMLDEGSPEKQIRHHGLLNDIQKPFAEDLQH